MAPATTRRAASAPATTIGHLRRAGGAVVVAVVIAAWREPRSAPRARLVRDRFGRAPGRLRISEIAAADRAQVAVELVDERNAGRDVELDDRVLGHAVEVLDQGAQAVAVGRDQHAASRK